MMVFVGGETLARPRRIPRWAALVRENVPLNKRGSLYKKRLKEEICCNKYGFFFTTAAPFIQENWKYFNIILQLVRVRKFKQKEKEKQ